MATDTDARRVALLARPGLARDRLSTALDEAGAHCVLAADPTQLNPDELRAMHPQVVLVALDALTEEVLEQFDAVLGDPSIDVIYEESEQAVAREGWDAARWQRHLVAKLQGHSNVLPPGREPSPVLASEPVVAAEPVAANSAPSGASAFDPVNAELDDFNAAVDLGSSMDDAVTEPADHSPSDDLSLSLESFDFSEDDMPSPMAPAATAPEPAPGVVAGFEFSLETMTGDDATTDFNDAIAFDAFDVVDDAGAASIAEDLVDDGATAPRDALSLHDDTLDLQQPDTVETRESFRHDLASLQERISALTLVDDTPAKGPEQPRGAVLVLSGLGGPDAVRQLLGALPAGFARPVLVQQRLEGGRYDRLVTQLQRATPLTVTLAEPAQVAVAGTVYILPDVMGATSTAAGIVFSDDAGDGVLAALPSADSAILMLSGSDPVHVDAAMTHSWAGALVAGQAAEGCYDAAASNALAARGGDVAAPAAMAQRLSARWSTLGSSNVQA